MPAQATLQYTSIRASSSAPDFLVVAHPVQARIEVDDHQTEALSSNLVNMLHIAAHAPGTQQSPCTFASSRSGLPSQPPPGNPPQATLVCSPSASNTFSAPVGVVKPSTIANHHEDTAARKELFLEKNESARSRGGDIPTEILEMALKYIIQDVINPAPGMASPIGLKELSTVCRAWHRHLSPLVYSKILIPWSQIDTFYNDLRAPQCLARPRIRKLTLKNDSAEHTVDSVCLGRLSKILGSTLTELNTGISLDEQQSQEELQRHMLCPRVLAGVCATFSALTRLELWNMVFSSSQDLLRLFGSLPLLTVASLYYVRWQKSVALAPFPRPSKLVSIFFAGHTVEIWPFMLCAVYPRSLGDSAGDSFAGLSREEALIAARISQHVSVGNTASNTNTLRFEKSPYPRTYTVTMEFFNGGPVYLQLHIQQPEDGTATVTTPSVSIRWIALRGTKQALGKDGYLSSREDVESINELLSRLPHLEKVVLEAYDDESIRGMNEIAGLLSNVVDKMHVWTFNEAREYTSDAYRKGLPTSNQLPISPLTWNDVREDDER